MHEVHNVIRRLVVSFARSITNYKTPVQSYGLLADGLWNNGRLVNDQWRCRRAMHRMFLSENL